MIGVSPLDAGVGSELSCIHQGAFTICSLLALTAQWKPSCKTKSAKWVYDGVCPDPDVFGALFGLDGPPNFKQKKYTVEEFEKHMGRITASVRYGAFVRILRHLCNLFTSSGTQV